MLTKVVQVLRPWANRFDYPQTTVSGIDGVLRHDKPSTTEPLLHFLMG
jgi:hypothetical protein